MPFRRPHHRTARPISGHTGAPQDNVGLEEEPGGRRPKGWGRVGGTWKGVGVGENRGAGVRNHRVVRILTLPGPCYCGQAGCNYCQRPGRGRGLSLRVSAGRKNYPAPQWGVVPPWDAPRSLAEGPRRGRVGPGTLDTHGRDPGTAPPAGVVGRSVAPGSRCTWDGSGEGARVLAADSGTPLTPGHGAQRRLPPPCQSMVPPSPHSRGPGALQFLLPTGLVHVVVPTPTGAQSFWGWWCCRSRAALPEPRPALPAPTPPRPGNGRGRAEVKGDGQRRPGRLRA